MQETKSLLHKERLKEKLGKQDFHKDMEEVFEPVTTKQAEATENQKQLSEKQIQASERQLQAINQQLHDSSQTTRQAKENQTRAIKEGIQEYDEISKWNIQLLASLVGSNQVDFSIVKTVSNLLNDKNKSQFSLEPITQDNMNSFTINPCNPQPVLIKGSTMTFQNERAYNLKDPDLQYFITNTQLDRKKIAWTQFIVS